MLNIDRITKILFFLASSVLVIRILFIYNTILVDDEAYYAIYARHLSWGYIDHGPVVAFLIWIFTCIFENSFTVRIGAVLLMSLLPFILYFFINRYFNNKSALILSILVTVNLMLHMNAVIITPDVPLAFFSILAILFYYIAYFEDQKYFTANGKVHFNAPRNLYNKSEITTTDFPLVLNTGRVRDQWHTRTKTGKVKRLLTHIPSPFLEMNKVDAYVRNLKEGDIAVVKSRRGNVRVKVKINYDSWPLPKIFHKIMMAGEIPPEEMKRVFNLGIGFCVIVADENVDETMKLIGNDCWTIGEIVV